MTNEELFEEHKNLVKYCYKKLHKDEFIFKSHEDLLQEGYLALWKTILLFDESLGIKFATYAFAGIQNAMMRWIKVNRSFYYNYYSLDAPIQDETTNKQINLSDAIPDYPDYLDIETISDKVSKILKKYQSWLVKTCHKTNESYINNRIYKAHIILNELVTKQHVTTRYIEEEYNINRTIVSNIFRELRESLKDDYPSRFKNGGKSNGNID